MINQLFFSIKQNIYFCIFGFFLVFFQITGFILSTFGNLTYTPLVIIVLIISSMLLGSLIGVLVGLLYNKLQFDPEKRLFKHACSNDAFCFFIFLAITISYIPIFLTYFPGILSYDFMIQLGQVQSGNYSDHHPFIHTLMIQLFYNFGVEFLLSGSLGIALYTITQFLILAFACTYSLFILFLLKVEKRYIFAILLFYIFFPNVQFMSISATKDTLFASFVLILISSLAYLFTTKSRHAFFSCHITMLIIGILGTLAFRNNGRYALLATIVITLIVLAFYKGKRFHLFKIFAITLASTIVGLFLLSTVETAIGCTQGDRREMLSIPIQQFARVVEYHGDELSDETITFLESCIAPEGLYNYDPYISDPVKSYTDTTFILNNASEFISTYINLGLTYPSDYINAFLVQNSGFLYIFDTSHATINSNEEIAGYGYIQTHELWDDLAAADIYKSSFFVDTYYALEEWTNSNAYLKIPLLNILMAPGIWLYFVLLLLACVLKDKRYGFLVPLAFLLGYYVTLVLGPTVQLRYIFPVMLCIPTLTILYLSRKEPYASTRNNELEDFYE